MNKKFQGDQGQPATPIVVHQAGEYTGAMQRCERCGEVLIDDRQANIPTGDKGRKRGFEQGKAVTKQGSHLTAGDDPEGEKCSAPLPPADKS
jgi:hypothetical protein